MKLSMRAVAGGVGALFPIAYIGYFLWHFIGVGGNSMEGVAAIGLGPTVLGLSVVGLLFLIGPLVKLLRGLSGVAEVARAGKRIADELPATEGFDADAAFANYMRNRAEPAEAPVPGIDPPIARPPGGFGRKIV